MKKTTIHTHHITTLADLHTPVSVYRKLRDRYPNALLLESADYHDRSDSKSFICLEPMAGFEAVTGHYSIQLPGQAAQTHLADDPAMVFPAFSGFVNGFESAPTELPFNCAGLFGYTSFEAVRFMEEITLKNAPTDNKDNPDLKYQLFRYVLVFDHFKNELFICRNYLPTESVDESGLIELKNLLRLHQAPDFHFTAEGDEQSNITDDRYRKDVEKGIAHCERGDVFQVVLSREFSQGFKGDDFNVYRSLRSINPSPYLFYFDYGNFRIFGSSPEAQLQVVDGTAEIHPIAGTVLRGKTAAEDQALADQLKNDPKEQAEHVMLVDLARNDLSKHAAEVAVDTYAEVQHFSHVLHLVSKVKGVVLPEKSGLDVFADTFPAGTLSGAPKYRALQIIDEAENVTRNFYGGAIGFFGFDGSVNHAIIIRSILSKNGTLTYQAGAGIVADSTPDGELNEVNNKVAALRSAIQQAQTL